MILYNQKEQTFWTGASFEATLRMVGRLISLKCSLISINL